jgi:hypothetical protein
LALQHGRLVDDTHYHIAFDSQTKWKRQGRGKLKNEKKLSSGITGRVNPDCSQQHASLNGWGND